VQPAEPRDRPAIERMLRGCGAFTGEEVAVALEVLDIYLGSTPTAGLDGDYPHLVARDGDALLGYVCTGKTPMTKSTFHLYWICVDPLSQRRGTGRVLMAAAERFAAARSGERMVVETAGKPAYEGTRRFYRDLGYQVARIADYYAADDALHLFVKRLSRPS
jgi:ribosomal protein S18 acetylase RimI-like enzyme